MAFIELIIISWFYGVDGFFKNVEEMKIKIPGFMKIYWKTCWLFITPLLIGNYIIAYTFPFCKNNKMSLYPIKFVN
jgi:hypothetical protein